jgi:hypothetical protein
MERESAATCEPATRIRHLDKTAELGELRLARIGPVDVRNDLPRMKSRTFGIWITVNEFDQLDGGITSKLVVDEEIYVVSKGDVWTV